MSDDYRRIEVITGSARRRNWSTRDKLQMIELQLYRVKAFLVLLDVMASLPIYCIVGGD